MLPFVRPARWPCLPRPDKPETPHNDAGEYPAALSGLVHTGNPVFYASVIIIF